MAFPANGRGIGWPPWPQHHSAISISFRLDQTKTRPAPVPSGQAGLAGWLPCPASASAERSNQGGNALTGNKIPSHDFMIRPRRQVASCQRISRDRVAQEERHSASPCPVLPASAEFPSRPRCWRRQLRYCRLTANAPPLCTDRSPPPASSTLPMAVGEPHARHTSRHTLQADYHALRHNANPSPRLGRGQPKAVTDRHFRAARCFTLACIESWPGRLLTAQPGARRARRRFPPETTQSTYNASPNITPHLASVFLFLWAGIDLLRASGPSPGRNCSRSSAEGSRCRSPSLPLPLYRHSCMHCSSGGQTKRMDSSTTFLPAAPIRNFSQAHRARVIP